MASPQNTVRSHTHTHRRIHRRNFQTNSSYNTSPICLHFHSITQNVHEFKRFRLFWCDFRNANFIQWHIDEDELDNIIRAFIRLMEVNFLDKVECIPIRHNDMAFCGQRHTNNEKTLILRILLMYLCLSKRKIFEF